MRSARHTALEILLRIETQKAYAAPLLANVLPRFSPKDRRLLVELVYGVLRWKRSLDWIIERSSRFPMARIDLPILLILRLGLYQFLFLSRIPKHAIVFTSVEMAKTRKGKKAGGFVNAVLRRVGDMGETALDMLPQDNTPEALGIRTSHPTWLVKRWIAQFGFSETEALCNANNRPPPASLRVNIQKIARSRLIETALRNPASVNIRIESTTYASHGISVTPLSAVYETDWLEKGLVTIQDEASQIVGEAVSPRKGERILDACAGVGIKATQILELSGNELSLLCTDKNQQKLKQLRTNARRLGFPPPICATADMEHPPLANQPIFDKVLLDAPCSNTGVIRRHPERKWRLREKDIAHMAQLQQKLVEAVAPTLKQGGILIYSTCSLEREEGEDVISHFLAAHRDYSLIKQAVSPDDAERHFHGGIFRSFPHKNGMDGFFCVRLIRKQT